MIDIEEGYHAIIAAERAEVLKLRKQNRKLRKVCADKVWSVLADYIEEQPRDGISAEGAVSDQLKAEQRAFVKGLRIARFKARAAVAEGETE